MEIELKRIPLGSIDEPTHDLRAFINREALEELMESIKHVGVLMPLRVFQKNNRYEIIDGHRRFLAARMAGEVAVPCFVVETSGDQVEAEKVEANLHREDISTLEIARMLNYLRSERGYSIESMAKLMGKSETRIYQILSTLEFDINIQRAMEDKRIPEHVGRLLNKIKNPQRRVMYLQHALDGNASGRTITAWVAQEESFELLEAPPQTPDEVVAETPVVARLTMICPCCMKEVNPNATLMLQLDRECYQFTKEVYRRMRQDEAKEPS